RRLRQTPGRAETQSIHGITEDEAEGVCSARSIFGTRCTLRIAFPSEPLMVLTRKPTSRVETSKKSRSHCPCSKSGQVANIHRPKKKKSVGFFPSRCDRCQ